MGRILAALIVAGLWAAPAVAQPTPPCSPGNGAWVITTSAATFYVCTSDGQSWVTIGSGGGASWGGVTGTLSAQTDLQNALNAKGTSNFSGVYADLTSKPTLGSAAATASTDYATAAQGTDARTPLTHSHAPTDTTGTAVVTNDSRLSDARTPTSHAHAPADTTGTAVITNDARLSDARTPTTHNHVDADIPNTITVDLATTATTANAGDSATGFFPAGTLEVARGGTNLAAAADDNVMVGNATTWETKALPSCSNATTSKLLYDIATNTFSCGTDQTAVGGATTLTSTSTQSDAVIATYTAITGLSFTPAASTNYLIDCYIVYTSTAATTGINFAWDTPASPTMILMDGTTKTVATGANEGFSQNSDNVGTTTSAAVITTQNLAVLHTLFKNGTTSAAMSLGFTPETANSVSVIAGSACQYRTF